MTRNLLEETIGLLVQEVLRGFNFNLFKDISRKDVRPRGKEEEEAFVWDGKSHPEVAYATQNLPKIGEGSSRIVFAFSSSKVLKIAKNEWGIAQNKAELELFTHSANNSLATKIFDYSPDYKWIVSEIVKPFENRRGAFTSHLGFNEDVLQNIFFNHKTFIDFQRQTEREPLPDEEDTSWFAQKIRERKKILANPKATQFIEDMFEMIKTHKLHPGDLVPEHFGLTVDGQIRLFDYGYNQEVARLYGN